MKIVRKSLSNKTSDSTIDTVHEYKGCNYIHLPSEKHITPLEYFELLKNEDVFLIDVREQYEYEQGHIGGQHIPLSMLHSYLDELPKDQPLIVHCKSGKRSLVAMQILLEHGFENARNLEGGLKAVNEHKIQS